LTFVTDIPNKLEHNFEDIKWYWEELSTDKGKYFYELEMIQNYFKSKDRSLEGVKLLDVGCGDGYFISLCKENNIDAYGYDISTVTADYARQKGINIFTNIKDIEDKYDIITNIDVFEHMIDPLNELSNLKNLLKEDGIILIETPRRCLADFYLSILRFLNIIEDDDRINIEHLQLFTDKCLKIMTHKSGLKIECYKTKTNLSWGGYKGVSQYVYNLGLHAKIPNKIVTIIVFMLLKLNIFGKNKAVILARNNFSGYIRFINN